MIIFTIILFVIGIACVIWSRKAHWLNQMVPEVFAILFMSAAIIMACAYMLERFGIS